jgi:hypothetical protein
MGFTGVVVSKPAKNMVTKASMAVEGCGFPSLVAMRSTISADTLGAGDGSLT